ncbi:LysR family transcriptional regulator [Rhizobium phaseoli]|uniref:LysR family transcriptional regulator n=1 Tax=Rhizobium phaseoli TaxID=396 RepID=UPI0007EBD32A|nr:LysR family transcriptional regulator [Rhizobium phaseoli]ANL33336.1 LysR family transcriptional regulator protein [Rhizobium phaseoli]ANL97064.1 LysR family transcriptional regulator protein [Rhizobium phaseoli]
MAEQKRTGLDWEDLRFFAALARHRSLSATARALKFNHATVARRIAALEQNLGVNLFERRADGYALSRQGSAILAETGVMEAAAAAIRDRLDAEDGPRGRVRLTTIRSLADLVLAPNLAEILDGLPHVELEIVTDIKVASLAQREADIALRLGHPGDSELSGRRVATIRYGFFGSKETRNAFDMGDLPPLITYDGESQGVAEARWLDHNFPDHPVSLRSGSNAVQAQAAASGLGLAMLPLYLAATVSGLEPVAFATPMPERELWMLTPAELAQVPRVRVVLDRLSRLFVRHKHLF